MGRRRWTIVTVALLAGCEAATPTEAELSTKHQRPLSVSVDLTLPPAVDERFFAPGVRPPTDAEYEAELQARASFLLNEAADYYHPPGMPSGPNATDPTRPYFRLLYPAPELHRNIRQYENHDPFRCCSDTQKYFWPLTIARFRKYPGDAEANYWVKQLAATQGDPNVTGPEATSRYPFHFAFPGIARILNQFAAEPEVIANEVTHLRQVWQRDDFYNAFDGEGTENHLAMSRASAYLLLERMKKYPSVFPPAQVAARLAQMRAWIKHFALNVYRTGPGEWDSNTYVVYTVASFLNLYDFAQDKLVRDWARAVLDFYAVALALKHTQGVAGGASMRGGELTSTSSDSSYLNWLWFGDTAKVLAPPTATLDANGNSTRLNRSVSGNGFVWTVHAAVSKYRPPRLATLLARKQLTVPATYFNSKGGMLMEGKLVKEVFHIGPNYTLGSTMSPYGGFTGGDTQTMNWKLTARASAEGATSALTVTGNGGTRPGNNGQGRMPWDQLVQHGNVLFQLSRIPSSAAAVATEALNLIDAPSASVPPNETADDDWRGRWERDMLTRFFGNRDPMLAVGSWERPENLVTKAQGPDPTATWSYISFADTGVVRTQRDGVFFLDLQGTYVAVRGLRSLSFVEEAAGTGRKQIKDAARNPDNTPAYDQVFGFVLEVGTAVQHGTFESFQEAILARAGLDLSALADGQVTYTSLAGDVITARYQSAGTFTEPIYNWGWGPTTRQVIPTSPPFLQPIWPSGEGHGRVAAYSVNGREVPLAQEWPLYSGPHLRVDHGRLRLNVGPYQYLVQFAGERPIFLEIH